MRALALVHVGLAFAAVACGAAFAADTERGEQIFRKALSYTVQIKSSVTMPFAGDSKGSGLGAGFVVDAERGWILTNAHVIARSPFAIYAWLRKTPAINLRQAFRSPCQDRESCA